jgi:hypothetical protein
MIKVWEALETATRSRKPTRQRVRLGHSRHYRAREVNLTRDSGRAILPRCFREASELTGDRGVQGQDFVPKHAFTRYGWVTVQFFRETHRTLARGDRSHGIRPGRDQRGD